MLPAVLRTDNAIKTTAQIIFLHIPVSSLCYASANKKNNSATQEAANGRGDTGKMEGAKKEKASKLSVERVYQKKTQLEHILLRPDTYIGTVEPITQVNKCC